MSGSPEPPLRLGPPPGGLRVVGAYLALPGPRRDRRQSVGAPSPAPSPASPTAGEAAA